MSIKCIALDMDRTTLNAQGKLSKENNPVRFGATIQAVEYVQRPRKIIKGKKDYYDSKRNGGQKNGGFLSSKDKR